MGPFLLSCLVPAFAAKAFNGFTFAHAVKTNKSSGSNGPVKKEQLAQFFRPAASLASFVIASQLPASTSSFGATHEPPTQTTFGSER